MRRLFIWIVPLLLLLLCSAALGEDGSYADALAAWQDVPRAAQDVSVPLDGFETQDIGLTEETIDGERPCAGERA